MRIVSLQPSISIVLERLGCLDLLAACTRYCLEAVPALRGLPVVHDSWSTTAEELLAARPDLVIASVPYRQESLAAILKAGCPVLALAPHSLADIEQDVRLIARATGRAEALDRAEQVIGEMRAGIEEVRRRCAALEKPLVYCEEWGKPLIHSQEWVKELVEAAGGVFLGEPGKTTTAEAVAEGDPEVVLAAWCGAGDRVPLEKVAGRARWSGMRAVREGRVFCIADELLNTPAPTLVEGLRAMAAALHPEVFGAEARGLRRMTLNRSETECV